jgi:hypothetical protein
MKRLLALLAGALGLRALLRRRALSPLPPEEPHADTLRAKLAETRAVEPDAVEPQDVALDSADAGVAERRADVHERARQAIDDLSK